MRGAGERYGQATAGGGHQRIGITGAGGIGEAPVELGTAIGAGGDQIELGQGVLGRPVGVGLPVGTRGSFGEAGRGRRTGTRSVSEEAVSG